MRRSEGWGGGFRGTGKEGFQSLWTHLRPFSGAPAHKQRRGRGGPTDLHPFQLRRPRPRSGLPSPFTPFKPRHATCPGLSGCSSQVGSLPVLGVQGACTLPAISQPFRSPESPEAPCPSSCTSDPIYGFSHWGGGGAREPCYRAVHLFLVSSLSSLRWPLSFLFLQPRVPLSLSKPLRLEGCGSKFAVPSRPHRKDLVLCPCSLAPLL